MSEKHDRGIHDLSKYDAMTTEELEEILRLDAQAPQEQESDTEMILYVMEVLAERKRENGHTVKTAQEAYESFKQNYMPEIIDNEVTPAKDKVVFPHWLRRLTVAAAAVLLVLALGSMTEKVVGFYIWEAVVNWTQETFHFGKWGNSNSCNNLPYASFQEALEKGNVPGSLVPQWIPDGYELVDISIDKTPLQNLYVAIYANGDGALNITVRDFLDRNPVYVEQSEGLVEEYNVSGITYYLFENNQQVQAVWIVETYECSISGDISINELKMMIDSIMKGSTK